MSRDLSPRRKAERREGSPLELFSRDASNPRTSRPGQHGGNKAVRPTDYGVRLREKQKMRRYYGMSEKQFKRFFELASHMKGDAGENFLQLLESRLDNVVYRMGFGSTRAEARQLVSHRCILVNGLVVNIASYLVQPGDKVEVRQKSKSQLRVKSSTEAAEQKGFVSWVRVDSKELAGTFVILPEMSELPPNQVNLIIEYYSK